MRTWDRRLQLYPLHSAQGVCCEGKRKGASQHPAEDDKKVWRRSTEPKVSPTAPLELFSPCDVDKKP